MDSRKVKSFLLIFLILAALVTGAYTYFNRYTGDAISDSELRDLTEILSRSGIVLEEGALDRSLNTGGEIAFAAFDRETYALSVAERISGSPRRTLQMQAGGCVITAENGTAVTLTSDFTLHCVTGTAIGGDYVPADEEEAASIGGELSALFGDSDRTSADRRLSYTADSVTLCRETGIARVILSQTWEGKPLEGFGGLAYVRDGTLLAFEGVWCFLAFTDSASSQLYSSLNILLSERTRVAESITEPRSLTDVTESYTVVRNGEKIFVVPALRLLYADGTVASYNRVTGEFLFAH